MDYIIEGFKEAFILIFSGDQEIYSIISLTFVITMASTLISTLIGIPMGVLIGLKSFKGKKYVMRLIHTQMSTPPVIAGLFVALIISRNGPLGSLQLIYTPRAMIIAQIILITPIVTGLVMMGVEKRGKQVMIDAKLLGANRRDQMFILIREERRTMLSAVVSGFGRAISEVGAVMIVGGNIRGHTRVMTTYIVMARSMGEYQKAIAMGIILLMISYVVNTVLYRGTISESRD